MSQTKVWDESFVAHSYKRFPVEIVEGKGSVVYDETGKRYIDMGSGIGVTSFGIADDVWKEAVTEQLGRLTHMSNLYYTEPCVKLAKILCERTGMKKVFFCNSGAEANEGAIKAARKYAAEHKGPEYHTIITLENSFHGRTITTLAATGQEHYHELFQPLTPGFVHAPANDLYSIKALVAHYPTAAIMIECVQGEGGVIPMDPEFVKGIAEICEQRDILLIVDEVQTGNGRTGELYAYMNYGIQPDLVSTAKGLGGGLPLGAVMFGEKVEYILGYGDHGSTFGGNPVCCAGAVSILERMDDVFLTSVKEKGKFIFDYLNGKPGITGLSGMGMMVGIKTVKPASEVIAQCMQKGVLCLSAKDKVRLLPALNIPMDVLEEALQVIAEVCAE